MNNVDILPQAQQKNSENENMPPASSHVEREMLRRARAGESAAGIADNASKRPAHDLFILRNRFAVTEEALQAIAEMTPIEVQIASQVALGKRNHEIAQTQYFCEGTIKKTLSILYAKMGLHEPDNMRVQLAVYMMHHDPSLLPESTDEWLEHLSPQASRAVSLMAQGMSNLQIAGEMGLNKQAVKNHLSKAFQHTQTRSREELAGLVWASIHQRTPLRLPETHLVSRPRHCAHDTLSQTAFAFTEEALRAIVEMTPHEVRIARQAALGKRNHEIAEIHHLSRKSIKNAFCRLYKKMGLHEPDNMRVKLAVYMMHHDPSLLPEPREWPEHLTPRVSRAISLVAQGMSNSQIAGEMGLNEKAVHNHLSGAFQHTQTRNREELARLVWACIHQKRPLRLPEALFASLAPGRPGLESKPRHSAHDILMSQTAFAITDDALRGIAKMTPGEVRIARQVALGRTNCEIAEAHHLSEKTIKNTLSVLYKKMGLHEPDNVRVKLAVYMMHHDPSLLPEPGGRLEHLTPQMSRAVSLMAQGISNHQIAGELGLCERAIKNHLSAAFQRAQTRNREELAGLVWACVHQRTPLRLPEVPGGSPGFVDRLESAMQRRTERSV